MEKTLEYFEKIFTEKSQILKYDPRNPTKDADPKKPPSTFRFVDWSEKGIEHELATILGGDQFTGLLEDGRKKVKRILGDIEAMNKTQGRSLDTPAPPDLQEDLNRARARVRVYEAESRHLHDVLRVRREERKNRYVSSFERRAQKRRGKYVDGVLVMFGGREVIQVDGVNVFKDNPKETVEAYIQTMRAEAKEKFKKKKVKEDALFAALEKVRAAG